MFSELEKIFDSKILEVLRAIYTVDKFQIRQLSDKFNVPLATTYRIVTKLIEADIVAEKREENFVTYFVNHNSEVLKFLGPVLTQDPLTKFVNEVKKIEQVIQIIEVSNSSTSGNVVIIGKGVDQSQINSIADIIEKETGFKILSGVFTTTQYQQMVSLGLQTGTRKILYNKI